MARVDLSSLTWRLECWRPFSWRLGRGTVFEPELGPMDAPVPGSVQEALRRTGILPDWNVGTRSRDCEWVEHRHWIYEAVIPAGMVADGEEAALVAEGLDYSGWVLIDDEELGRFEGALIPHRFALGARLGDGAAHRLALVFEEPPREQGQIGYTSRSRYFKPRYTYSWDWCPRVVPVGVWEPLYLETGAAEALRLVSLRPELGQDLNTGCVTLRVAASKAVVLHVELLDAGNCVQALETALLPGDHVVRLEDIRVEAWWPNGMGTAKTYGLSVRAADAQGRMLWQEERQIGFRRVEWRACEGAPEGAEPWLCVVNGQAVFLQGANWVPPRICYHDSTAEEYGRLLELYREMGCNVLRVWGGAILEKSVFYDLCDRNGLLVWQEFPLSSSGVENYPPEDPESIARLCEIAVSYIRKRAHHASLLLWCGGNELTERGPEARPIGYAHPCITALKRVVEAEDPGRRFLPTSPSGPEFYAHAKNYGTGVHHDTHGPWGLGFLSAGGFADLEAWRKYWDGDDSLFRSEVGMPGASSRTVFEEFRGGLAAFPPVGEYWQHGSAWWTQWERFQDALAGLDAEAGLDEYIRLTQAQQAEAYAYAAERCKGRFPRCGGFIIWMGHDCYPCPANNSVIDFQRNPKPAYEALRRVFLGQPCGAGLR